MPGKPCACTVPRRATPCHAVPCRADPSQSPCSFSCAHASLLVTAPRGFIGDPGRVSLCRDPGISLSIRPSRSTPRAEPKPSLITPPLRGAISLPTAQPRVAQLPLMGTRLLQLKHVVPG